MNCWNPLKPGPHSVAGNGKRDGLKRAWMNLPYGIYTLLGEEEMGNQQPSTCVDLSEAVINVRLGDGHFWRHPECKNSKVIWSSICEDWVRWKQEQLLPASLRGSINVRSRKKDRTYPNARPIWTAASLVHPDFTDAHEQLDCFEALTRLSDLGLGMWFLDDGCTVRRNDGGSLRVSISLGPELSSDPDFVLDWARDRFGTASTGRVAKNNSRASERNKVWIVPKPIAVQILMMARKIAPSALLYKAPTW